MDYYNNFIINLSGPSGCGKSTITKELLQWNKNIKLSISVTTRFPRGQEQNGVEYFFITKEEFEKKIKNNEFAEYAIVHDNYYGTLKSELNNNFRNGDNVILDIDWQGTIQVSKQFEKERLLKIFILPPDLNILEQRLKNRATDSYETIKKRVLKAKEEILHYKEYDYVIINHEIQKTYNLVKSIIDAKIVSNTNQTILEDFVHNIANKYEE